ncbi:MAG: hypothetical protein QY325_07985 [Flavobacteriales bacterium]|nr:MAG: hypothetical protein QY325_07985 [Flavobacteriales bacterium]
METSSALRSPVVEPQARTYSAWLEVEIGLDTSSIALSWRQRKQLFEDRIEACLQGLERATPGIRAKLEVHPARPFAFTGALSVEDIRAIWHLPELRMLSDRDAQELPVPDDAGRLPYAVEVLQHVQAEESTVVDQERMVVIVHATDEDEAKRIALAECSTMPAHFMGGDYRIHRRWWTAERAILNTLYDERTRHGEAIVVDQWSQSKLKDQLNWRPDASVEHVAYGSPKQRPSTWEWMIAAP